MRGSDLKKNVAPVRGMIVGYPKAGKTPALASLLNAGYKVRLINFEALNYKSLLEFTDERALDNLDVVTLSDPYHMGEKWMEPLGDPKSFNDALSLMKEWKSVDGDGKPYSLGKPSEWGPDTVLCLDSLTAQGEASYRRTMKMNNRSPGTFQLRDYGFVVNDQVEMLRLMGRADRRYHFLVIAHLQVVSPDMIQDKEEETNKQIKRELGELVNSRIYPKAATRNLSTFIAKEFPMIVQAKQEDDGKRYIYTQAGTELDLAVPFRNAKRRYSLDTGLEEIFEGWGHTPPGFPKKGK